MKKFRGGKRKFVRRQKKRSIRKVSTDAKRFFKLKLVSNISTDASGIISQSYTDDPSSTQDWSSVAALFDRYKVNAIKIKFIPAYYASEAATGLAYRPLYLVFDPNSTTTPLSNINTAIEYENCKFKNMIRPWTYYHKMAKTIANASGQSQDGYKPTAAPVATQGIYGYGSGFNASVLNYGITLITYYVTAKNRK